jgi:hypothetical protein
MPRRSTDFLSSSSGTSPVVPKVTHTCVGVCVCALCAYV